MRRCRTPPRQAGLYGHFGKQLGSAEMERLDSLTDLGAPCIPGTVRLGGRTQFSRLDIWAIDLGSREARHCIREGRDFGTRLGQLHIT